MKPYKTIEEGPNEVTAFEELDLSKKYSYADYLTWKFKERVEIIKGHIFKMSPAPGMKHQRISSRIHIQLGVFMNSQGNKCEIFSAPFDVRFPKASADNEHVFDIVQPDLCVVCELSKLDERGCLGAPDLIVEILSPGSLQSDLKEKYELYERNSVGEYWVVHPEDSTVLIYRLNEGGKYQASRLFTKGDKVNSVVLPGLELDLNEVFDFE